MTWLPELTNEQNIRLDAIIARRDACFSGRHGLALYHDAESYTAIIAIARDQTQSPDDLLDALDVHVAKLEKLRRKNGGQ